MSRCGKKIVIITRPQPIGGRAGDVLGQFAEVKADLRWIPLLELRTLDESIEDLEIERLLDASPSCLAFTSANAVEALVEALRRRGQPTELPLTTLVAAQGRETATTVETLLGRRPEFIPSSPLSSNFGAELATFLKAASTVFYPTSFEAGSEFDLRIQEKGHTLVRWNLYVPVPRLLTADELSVFSDPHEEQLVLLFMSPSAVREAKRQLPPHGAPVWNRVQIVTIGPVTSSAVRDVGWRVDYESPDHSVSGLVRLLNDPALFAWSGD
jgi:uroporphyrinogen-III synthase